MGVQKFTRLGNQVIIGDPQESTNFQKDKREVS